MGAKKNVQGNLTYKIKDDLTETERKYYESKGQTSTYDQHYNTNKKPFYKKWWFVLSIIILIAAASSALNPYYNNSENDAQQNAKSANGYSENFSDNNSKEVEEDVEIFDHFEVMNDFTCEKDSFSLSISGKVKNLKGRDLTYAQISFNLYDKDGAQIGTAFDNINNLEKDGVWKFKAVSFSPEGVETFKLVEISCF